MKALSVLVTIAVLHAGVVVAAEKKSGMENCPLHAQHMAAKAEADGSHEHGAKVDGRHDSFGMSHEATHHSFRMFADGGAIELYANDPNDEATIESIRAHLQEINAAFTKADFATPAFVHGKTPAGVEEMKRLHQSIRYRFEEHPAGGRIRITTRDTAALTAVHDFMKFQVIEHRTKDRGIVEEE